MFTKPHDFFFFFFKENVKALVWLKACLFIFFIFIDLKTLEVNPVCYSGSSVTTGAGVVDAKFSCYFLCLTTNNTNLERCYILKAAFFFFIGVCVSLFICF